VRHSFARSLQALLPFALCASPPGLTAQATPPADAPLASFAAQRVVVMPIQFLRADSLSPVKALDWDAVRKEVDDSIGAAISERGIGKKWMYAADVARGAKRNAGYVGDPYALGGGSLRAPRAMKPEEQAPRVLIDNMRSHIALGDARYALLPLELVFAKRGAESRTQLRVVLVDGRVGQIVWYSDLSVDTGGAFGSAAIGMLAQRVADIVAAR
jgi:hypothetical protein